ncbi:uncharacterized protein LOC133716992 [Rosa rugosa]|uniref:uncharacterized protein LOC133716992 n=1 Tax=Rosa rugosa TaxID=74645 RepID=UPI002B415A8F|nr:uncharacterized protein LOC133716992 [Rosa rugosa]
MPLYVAVNVYLAPINSSSSRNTGELDFSSCYTHHSFFGQLKTTYFTQKDKWDLNELIAICVQEEDRIKRDGPLVVNLISKSKWKGKGKAVASSAVNSGEGTSGTKPYKLGPKKSVNSKGKKPGVFKCFFCKKEGHMKKNCQGFKDWMAKKGLSKQESSKEK